MNAMEIANTINQQIKATLPTMVLWSWGKSAEQFLNEEQLKTLKVDGLGALKFRVNGMKHKGHVLVVLNYTDTYDVYICNIRKNKMTIKNSSEGLYCDNFASWIDEQVEKQANYAY